MLRCTAVVSAICSLAFSASADSSIAALAAPGDCAQPSSDFETPPLYEQPAGVSGSASEHFAPKVGLLGLLPLALTRTRTATTLSGVADATADGASGAVGATADAVGETADGIGSGIAGVGAGAGDAIGAPAIDSVAGGVGGALGGVSSAVDTLTGAASTTATGALGVPK